jgi:Cu+-exporting ATPase
MKNTAFALLLGAAVFAAGCKRKEHDHKHDHDHKRDAPAPSAALADPVCGMKVAEGSSKGAREANGKKFGFCSEGCLKTFDADPKKYGWGYCGCAKTMPKCDCGHCKGQAEPCGCTE